MRKELLLIVSMGLSAASVFVQADGLMPGGGQAAARAAAGGRERFVGTWRLVNREQRDAKGQVVAPAQPEAVGYIIYDPAGYMAVAIMPLGRPKYAGTQATPQEAKAAITGYTAYHGTFSVNEAEGFVTHHVEGSVNPGTARDQKRFFELSGNRLTLKPPPGPTGTQSSLTWERMPDVVNQIAVHKQFIGFWKLISNERRNPKGELVSSNPGQTGYIIYTASGHMMVQMMQPGRKAYAAAQPTPEEASAALRTYTNYFGPFYIHETDRYVVHDQIATLNVGQIGPSPQQRFYEFSGRLLKLRPPPTTVDGQRIQGTITWERVSGTAGTQ